MLRYRPLALLRKESFRFETAAELLEWTNRRVDAKFQRISDVILMDSFPRNVAGKTLKRELREQYRRG